MTEACRHDGGTVRNPGSDKCPHLGTGGRKRSREGNGMMLMTGSSEEQRAVVSSRDHIRSEKKPPGALALCDYEEKRVVHREAGDA